MGFGGFDDGAPAVYAELVTNMADMGAYCFRGDEQGFRNFLVGVAPG